MAGVEEILPAISMYTGGSAAFGNFGVHDDYSHLGLDFADKNFTPSELIPLVGLAAGSLAVLYSGFRSAVANALMPDLSLEFAI